LGFVTFSLYRNNIRMTRFMMRWAGHAALWGRRQTKNIVLLGKTKEADRLEDCADVNWIVILKWVSKKYDVMAWTGSIWLRIGPRGGLLSVR
jgi:hypothetical protein